MLYLINMDCCTITVSCLYLAYIVKTIQLAIIFDFFLFLLPLAWGKTQPFSMKHAFVTTEQLPTVTVQSTLRFTSELLLTCNYGKPFSCSHTWFK